MKNLKCILNLGDVTLLNLFINYNLIDQNHTWCPNNLIKYKDSLFVDNTNLDHNIYIYLNIDHKLVNLDFKKQYSIHSFKYLDELNNAKKLDYSIEIT